MEIIQKKIRIRRIYRRQFKVPINKPRSEEVKVIHLMNIQIKITNNKLDLTPFCRFNSVL